MDGLLPIIDLLTVAAALAAIAWALNLWRTGLHRRYPVLLTYLVFAAGLTVGSYVAYNYFAESVIFGWYWVVVQPLSWTLYFCLLVEAHNRMLFGFKGFERLGQLLIYAASGTVAMVFLGMMFLEASRETWEQFWFLQRRSIYIGADALHGIPRRVRVCTSTSRFRGMGRRCSGRSVCCLAQSR